MNAIIQGRTVLWVPSGVVEETVGTIIINTDFDVAVSLEINKCSAQILS